MKTLTNTEVSPILINLLSDQLLLAQISPICNGFIKKGNLAFPDHIPGSYMIYGEEKVTLEIRGKEEVTFSLTGDNAKYIIRTLDKNLSKTKEFARLT
jgi:hypothetical protein